MILYGTRGTGGVVREGGKKGNFGDTSMTFAIFFSSSQAFPLLFLEVSLAILHFIMKRT